MQENSSSNAALREPQWTGRMALIVLLAGFAFGLAMVARVKGLLSDEGFHAQQIWDFYSGRWVIRKDITMIPTYHAAEALLIKMVGVYNDRYLRVLSFGGSLVLPLAAFGIARRQVPREAGRRVLQTFFFPLLFPFFFLVYTDCWCLGALLGLFYFAGRRWFVPAGVCGLLAVALRQDSVLWVGLAWLQAALEGGPPLCWRTVLRNGAKRAWPLLVVMLLFVGFVIENHGVAVGDRTQHQTGFNVTNLYSLLIWAWVLFLPVNLRAVPVVVRAVRRRWWLALIGIGCLPLFVLTFSNTHPYNHPSMRDWLHNQLLYYMGLGTTARVLFYLPAAWMTLTFAVTKFPTWRHALVLPFGALYACMHPLVEPRYYLASLVLFQLWREPLGDRWEDGVLAYNVLVAVVTFHLVCVKLTFP